MPLWLELMIYIYVGVIITTFVIIKLHYFCPLCLEEARGALNEDEEQAILVRSKRRNGRHLIECSKHGIVDLRKFTKEEGGMA